MARAFTPGLKVNARTRHRCRRLLPIAGEVRVGKGDSVAARDVVAEAFMPGDVTPVNVANLLSLPPGDVPECMLVAKGDAVEEGRPLARTRGIFGMFKSECAAKVTGTIESISGVTGQVIIRGKPQPLQVLAYLSGEVAEVLPDEGVEIEADVTFIQGIFGIGGETYGEIRTIATEPDAPLPADAIVPEMKGQIVAARGRVTHEALKKAVATGVSAVVAGGIDDEDLKDFLGYDLGVAITGSEKVGLTLVITEGFGDIAMAQRTWDLLQSREGDFAAVNGTTQIRAGVMRPEIVIPLTAEEAQHETPSPPATGYLQVGTPVRVIRDPYFGQIGTVSELPAEPAILASGSRARVLRVEFEAGGNVVVPRANVELIEQ